MKFRMILCVTFFVVPVFVFSATGNFSRTLFVGIRGEDVRVLQKVLNADMETRIASTGPGSLGFETDYFGLATKRALVKFQEKYRAEVLVPLGLTSGTGVFGGKTRAKAQMFLIAATLPKSTNVEATTSIPAFQKGGVFIYYPSTYSGKPGTGVSLTGLGFTDTDNTIYFDPAHTIAKATASNGQILSFKIPVVPKGIYHFFVKNARGESKKDAFFAVTDGITPEPKIESISPESVVRGGVVTVKGSGFTEKGNMVRTGVTVFENISSADGKSLSFVIPANILTGTTTAPAKKFSLPVWVFVVNENGVSNGKSFDLQF